MSNLFEAMRDLEGYLFRIVDNGGESIDRYTVIFSSGDYLTLSENPNDGQGFSSNGIDVALIEKRVEEGRLIDLAIGDLASVQQRYILEHCNDSFEEILTDVENKEPRAVSRSREEATANEGAFFSSGTGIYSSPAGYMVKLDSDPSDDRGPYKTAREAVLASLPDWWGLSGAEYHTSVDIMRAITDKDVERRVTELEAKLNENADFSP